jgi:hypothetical protein
MLRAPHSLTVSAGLVIAELRHDANHEREISGNFPAHARIKRYSHLNKEIASQHTSTRKETKQKISLDIFLKDKCISY